MFSREVALQEVRHRAVGWTKAATAGDADGPRAAAGPSHARRGFRAAEGHSCTRRGETWTKRPSSSDPPLPSPAVQDSACPVCPIRQLPPTALARLCDAASLPFETTHDARQDEPEFIGQDIAIEALDFGLAVLREGYNLFAVGPSGVGKQTLLCQRLTRRASDEPRAEDWCYVHNFADKGRPRALRLPAGRAAALRADMERTVAELQSAMRAALEGEEYRTRKQKLFRDLEDRQDKAFRSIERPAREAGVSITRERDLFAVSPLRDGKVMQPAEFDELPEPEQARLKALLAPAEDRVDAMLQEFNEWGRRHREALDALERATASSVGSRVFGELRSKYSDLPAVLDFLAHVEADLADSAEEFIEDESDEGTEPLRRNLPMDPADSSSFELRATVNVFVDQDAAPGAPVVYEDHPTEARLMGRIEYAAQFGSLVADFTLIKPGALQRARGGFLLMDAARLLENPPAWAALKRSLRTREIRVASNAEHPESSPTVSLEPEPIPLDQTKIVLFGERELYDLLAEIDADFLELFKVLVDFEDRMDRTPQSEIDYASLVARLIRKDDLSDFSRSAVARVLDHAARLAEDSGKLSVQMRPILDLMREADAIARTRGARLVSSEHVQSAIDAQHRRSGRVRQHILEDVRQGITLIACAGARIGQINGLSVVKSGEHSFGLTVRITARAWIGKGELIDIEREVELGGPLHSKGVLILSGLLAARYATTHPLSLSASLVFEQSYASVEGDSASLAEACALMSALADLPISQSIAVTGSLSQHGEVQAIGGVNEKIEGFFDVCCVRGLTGSQGVVIPNSNARHLMLKSELVAAVQAGQFHVWTAETLDDALSLLFGRDMGQRDVHGHFPEGSVNAAIAARLRAFAENRRRFLGLQAADA
jgi:lon-related putative ATP-dependent protease